MEGNEATPAPAGKDKVNRELVDRIFDKLKNSIAVEPVEGEVKVTPREQLGSFKYFPKMENFRYRAGWPIHSKDLPDEMLSNRLRYQLWSLRFE